MEGRQLALPHPQVFTEAELRAIADLCIKHDLIALCDEVYEHLVFGGARHVSLRSLPGMAERAVRLGSAGKTFSFTAWKVGCGMWGALWDPKEFGLYGGGVRRASVMGAGGHVGADRGRAPRRRACMCATRREPCSPLAS